MGFVSFPEQFKVFGLREEGTRWNFAAFPAKVVLFQEETLRGNCLSNLFTVSVNIGWGYRGKPVRGCKHPICSPQSSGFSG